MNPLDGSAHDATLKQFLTSNIFLGQSERYRILERREAYYRALQHEWKPHDWDGNRVGESTDPPSQILAGGVATMTPLMPGYVQLRFRRPDIKYPLARRIVSRFTAFMFPPIFEVEDDRDTEDFLVTALANSNWRQQAKKARNHGGAMGSAVMTFVFRNGRTEWRAVNPKYCTPYWDKDGDDLEALEIQFKIPDEERDPKSGKFVRIWKAYRRVITTMTDTEWPLTKIEGGLAKFNDEQAVTIEHGFGFVPAEWTMNIEDDDADDDGSPDCEGIWELLDAIDILLAQINKGAKSNIDPTLVLKVNKLLARAGIRKGSDNALTVGNDGDAKYLELNGTSLEIAIKVTDKFRQYALDTVGCVLDDPELQQIPRSGVAIDYLYRPMKNVCDDLRDTYGEFYRRLLVKWLKAVRTLQGRKVTNEDGTTSTLSLNLPMKTIADEVDGKIVTRQEPRNIGDGKDIVVKWGAYFTPTEDEKKERVTTASSAVLAKLISQETGCKYVGPDFGVRDIKAEMEMIKAESDVGITDRIEKILGTGGKIPEFPQEGEAEAKAPAEQETEQEPEGEKEA